MFCGVEICRAAFVFDLQPCNGTWKLNKYVEHTKECFGQLVHTPGASSSSNSRSEERCAPAYSAQQVARCILEEAAKEPNVNRKTSAALVKEKYIYRRQPPFTHYRTIRKELFRHLPTS